MYVCMYVFSYKYIYVWIVLSASESARLKRHFSILMKFVWPLIVVSLVMLILVWERYRLLCSYRIVCIIYRLLMVFQTSLSWWMRASFSTGDLKQLRAINRDLMSRNVCPTCLCSRTAYQRPPKIFRRLWQLDFKAQLVLLLLRQTEDFVMVL